MESMAQGTYQFLAYGIIRARGFNKVGIALYTVVWGMIEGVI